MAEGTLNSVKFKIGPNGVEFEASGDSDFIEREREKFNEMIPPITRVIPFNQIEQVKTIPLVENQSDFNEVPLITSEISSNNKYINFAHLIKEKGFNTDLDKVIGAAYYISEIKGINNFTREDIIAELKSAKIPALTNISDAIARCIKKVLLNENSEKIDGKRSFCIVQPGIDYCLNYTPKEDSPKKSNKSNKTKTQKVYPSLSIAVDDLHMEEKYCDITQLSKTDEQVWVLMYMYTKETEFNTFTKKELQKIMKEKFNLSLTDDQIRRFFENAGKNVDKVQCGREHAIKLLQGGLKKAEEIINTNK